MTDYRLPITDYRIPNTDYRIPNTEYRLTKLHMKKTLHTIFIVLLTAQVAWAQTQVTGTVTDENDQPLAGANILIKGKVAGTVSASDGSFTLNSSTPPPFTLVVSMVGFQKQEVEVTSQSTLNVRLVESNDIM